jgi:hypothetical protein
MLTLPAFTTRSVTLGGEFTLFVLVIYKIISSKLNTKRYREESARRGCLPALTLHSKNLLGTSRLKESIKATKEDRGPQYVVSAMNEVGTNIHTVRVPILDYELLVTRDPENVKAMFSTQNSDYDISATRANAFMPLLGEGIFTSRGAQWKHSRALVRPQFSREEVSNLDLVERHTQTLLNILKVGKINGRRLLISNLCSSTSHSTLRQSFSMGNQYSPRLRWQVWMQEAGWMVRHFAAIWTKPNI